MTTERIHAAREAFLRAPLGRGMDTSGPMTAALAAADAVMFSPENIARVVQATGLSLHSVSAVARELRATP